MLTFAKKNKKLNLLSYLWCFNLVAFACLLLLSAFFTEIFSLMKSFFGSSSIKNHTLWEFIYESGKVSHIQHTINKATDGNYTANIHELIKSFLNDLNLPKTNPTNQTTNVNLGNLKTEFTYFNAIIQLSVFFFVTNWLLFLSSIACLAFLAYESIKKNSLYDFLQSLLIFFFGVYGWVICAGIEKQIIKHGKFNVFIWPIWNSRWPLIQLIRSIMPKNYKFQKSDIYPLITIKNLYFSYYIKHNIFKHYWDHYKTTQTSNKLNEEDHLFSFSNLFQPNQKIEYILQNIDLVIQDKSFNVIVGPNGCGKSTLLKLMINVYDNHSNNIRWYNNLLSDIDKKDFYKKVAYLPQEINVPDLVNIYDFLSYARLPHSSNTITTQDRLAILKAIKSSGCYEFNSENINELSGGQKQKVLIASLLAKESDIIVLDEPTSFFDLKNQIKFLNSLKKLQEDEGKTIIVVLHDLEQAIKYASNIIVLNDSKIYAQGEPKKIINEQLLSDVFKIKCDIDFESNSGILSNIVPIN